MLVLIRLLSVTDREMMSFEASSHPSQATRFHGLVRRRLLILATVTLVSLVAAFFAARVRFSSSIEMWFLEGDPELQIYDAFTDRFGGDEIAVIGVAAADVFDRGVLRVIDRLSRAAAQAPYVLSVHSLTTDVLDAPLDEISDASLRAHHQRATASSLAQGWFLSADATATPIVVEMDREGNTVEGKTALVGALRELVDLEREASPEIHLFLAGTPVLDEAFFRYNNRDISVLFPVMIGLVLIAGILCFRRLSAAILQLSVVVISVLWVFGLMGALGLNMSILSTALPPLLLAIGIADSVHLLSEYDRRLAGGSPRERAVVESVAHLIRPCTFTSLTTAVGLLSLMVSPMRPIREFGWLAAIGVLFAYLLSISFLPAVLLLLPPPRRIAAVRAGVLDRFLVRVARPSPAVARLLVAGGAGLLAGSLWLIAHLAVGVYALSWFPDQDPVVADIQQADRELGGSSSLEFLVDAPKGGMAEPAVLRKLYDFERWLESTLPGVTRAMSIADLYRDAGFAYDGDASRDAVEALYAALEQSGNLELHRLVQSNHQVGRITARMRLDHTPKVVHAFEEIDRHIETEVNGPDLTVKMTGYVRLMGRMEDYLIASQIRSFTLAFCAITLMMIVLLRSWRLGLFAMIPNLLPVAMGLGAMSLLDISLNPGTIMIGAIALGLVVDDTVHFLVALRRQLGLDPDLGRALEAASRQAGRAIVQTSLILILGFGVLTLGSFSPNVHFGAVAALTIAFALVADLVLLPAALTVFRPRVEFPPTS